MKLVSPSPKDLLLTTLLLTLSAGVAACPGQGAGPAPVSLTATPDPVGLRVDGRRSVHLQLAEPAATDLTLAVTIADPTLASVPASVAVVAGDDQATLVVDGLAPGSTTLTVAGNDIAVHVVAPTWSCGAAVTGSLSAAGELLADDAGDLTGAGLSDPGDHLYWTLTPRDITLECVDDIAPAGTLPVGPAVKVGLSGGSLEKWVDVSLPFKGALLPDGAHHGLLRVAVKLRGYPSWTPPLTNPWVEPGVIDGRLRFRYDEGATFQVVVPESAGQPRTRRYTYRAILGFSMGGGGAGSVGLRNPDIFDFIVQAGGEPGVDMVYSLQSIEDYLLGGFCTAADEAAGLGNLGELCDNQRPGLYHQHERRSSFERWSYEPEAGTGIHLEREFYLRAMRDLVRAFGNPFFYNPNHAVLPPGVDATYLSEPDPCGNPRVLTNFYDREFNPDGSLPVITFCDASEDEDSPTLGYAIFDPNLPKTNPMYVALAVDVNANGVRDSGEPIVQMRREPFEDVGPDGLPDASEVGFDPVTNPDPAADNYHWVKNPTGTEGNWTYDAGEPYTDSGLDGVLGAGCEVEGGTPGCYDHGEGNGVFDITPGYQNWLDHGARSLYARLTPAERGRIDVWSDSGMRDFFNCHISTNQFAGQQAALGEQVRVFWGFQRMAGDPPTVPNFDHAAVAYETVGRHPYIRYGNPDASESAIALGDGRHVGTGLEFIFRLNTPFAFMNKRWPGGDRDLENDDRPQAEHFLGDGNDPLIFTAANGRETPYSVYLPPGYFLDKNASLTYPVVYVLHGYGMEPDDLIAASGIFENYMIGPFVEAQARFQKMIIVYVDGRCRPGGHLGLNGSHTSIWTELGADACERGTFYADSPTGSTALGETHLLELMDIIDADYRTKDPEEVQVID